jgi:hypothetical protein
MAPQVGERYPLKRVSFLIFFLHDKYILGNLVVFSPSPWVPCVEVADESNQKILVLAF